MAQPHTIVITKKVLISALDLAYYVQEAVVPEALHLPITIDILELAARIATLRCFRLLWHQSGRTARDIAQDLIMVAGADNDCGDEIARFLLDEANDVEIEEKVIMAIVAGRRESAFRTIQLLLERDLLLDNTKSVVTTALANPYLDHDMLSLLLSRSSGIEVTEDMFLKAVRYGHTDSIYILSEHSKMVCAPEKWVDIARLSKSAIGGRTALLKLLIDRGVELDTLDSYGDTPLANAVYYGHRSAVQILLSAGASPDGGPACLRSPLYDAACRGVFAMVKLLTEAGARIYFKDHVGRTPLMIASEYGHMQIARYLEQCGKRREAREDSK